MSNIDQSRIFTRKQVDTLLTASIGKSLLQVDKAHLFVHHEGRDKVKGIAGDIIEVSVLGCKKDSKQEPVVNEEFDVVMKVMQTSTTYSQHSLQGTQLLYTNRSHCSLCGQSFVSSSHRQPNALKSRTRYIAKDYTRVRCLGRSLVLQASAPS